MAGRAGRHRHVRLGIGDRVIAGNGEHSESVAVQSAVDAWYGKIQAGQDWMWLERSEARWAIAQFSSRAR